MQRRIGLAQALINNPELILLDEPTSGLDPIGTAEIKELIRDLQRAGQDDRPLGPPPGRHAGHLRPDRDPPPRRAEGAGQGLRPADGPGRHPDQDPRPARGGARGDPRGDRAGTAASCWRSTTRRRRSRSCSCGSSARATCTRAAAASPTTGQARPAAPGRARRDAGRVLTAGAARADRPRCLGPATRRAGASTRPTRPIARSHRSSDGPPAVRHPSHPRPGPRRPCRRRGALSIHVRCSSSSPALGPGRRCPGVPPWLRPIAGLALPLRRAQPTRRPRRLLGGLITWVKVVSLFCLLGWVVSWVVDRAQGPRIVPRATGSTSPRWSPWSAASARCSCSVLETTERIEASTQIGGSPLVDAARPGLRRRSSCSGSSGRSGRRSAGSGTAADARRPGRDPPGARCSGVGVGLRRSGSEPAMRPTARAGLAPIGPGVSSGVRLGATYMGYVVLARVLWLLVPRGRRDPAAAALRDRPAQRRSSRTGGCGPPGS